MMKSMSEGNISPENVRRIYSTYTGNECIFAHFAKSRNCYIVSMMLFSLYFHLVHTCDKMKSCRACSKNELPVYYDIV